MTHSLSPVVLQASEWALIRRHASEDIFGMQLAGSHPELMGRLCKVGVEW